jgi:hypothetical protein
MRDGCFLFGCSRLMRDGLVFIVPVRGVFVFCLVAPASCGMVYYLLLNGRRLLLRILVCLLPIAYCPLPIFGYLQFTYLSYKSGGCSVT